MPGFRSFSVFLHHFVLAKLATSSIKVGVQTLTPHVITCIRMYSLCVVVVHVVVEPESGSCSSPESSAESSHWSPPSIERTPLPRQSREGLPNSLLLRPLKGMMFYPFSPPSILTTSLFYTLHVHATSVTTAPRAVTCTSVSLTDLSSYQPHCTLHMISGLHCWVGNTFRAMVLRTLIV